MKKIEPCTWWIAFNKMLLLLLMFFISSCSGDDESGPGPRNIIDGVVIDGGSNLPIAGANISTDNAKDYTTSTDGTFFFSTGGLQNNFQLNACAPGYKNACQIVSFPDVSVNTKSVNFVLDKSCDVEGSIDVDGDGIPCEIDWISDSDADGVADTQDECPGIDDEIDLDDDDVPDCIDGFVDSDLDGTIDDLDICRNADDMLDIDADGVADCSLHSVDYDSDGLSKRQEDIVGTNPYHEDSDLDTIDDLTELGVSFLSPKDHDEDGLIDALDDDSDNDGVGDMWEFEFDIDRDGNPDHIDNNVISGKFQGISAIVLESGNESQITVSEIASSDVCTCFNPPEIFSETITFANIQNNISGAENTLVANVLTSESSNFNSIQVLNSDLRWVKVTSGIDSNSQARFALVDGGIGDLDGVPNGRTVSLIAESYNSGISVVVVPVPSPNTEDSSSDCFIATAAYGSPIEDEVMLLRAFRDRYLLGNAPGRYFVRLYYKYSPRFATTVDNNIVVRALVLTLLAPIVFIIKYPMSAFAGTLTIVACLIFYRRRKFV